MSQNDYIVIKAQEDGVQVIGLTRGADTKFGHSEKLDSGEILVAQFTEHVSAIKVRGDAEVHSAHGMVKGESRK
ncbi:MULTISPECIES: trp RNA-binding attenuation protein MtrB [Bhargavaea]|uniref:Transcription attenuation protein MtrB n=1 Tax=Bhargavaea changchunensis TaxID=2134037 RepID=A0ABW2NHK3_9BACL|nr:trp RNA-binding attenuation protein MtrB [Bhargavaea sp. CC-171006]